MLIECNTCEAVVDAEELHSIEKTDDIIGLYEEKYTFLQCPRCKNPLVAFQEEDVKSEREKWEKPKRVFPQEDMLVNPRLPKPIRLAYQEALTCYKAKAYTAAAIMCRKTLEGICNEHGVKKKDLASSLKEMKDTGIIDHRLFEWAEALRTLGNEAVHGVNVTIPRQDAKDTLDFTNALLEYIFTFRDKFDAFMKRRQGKTTSAGGN